MKKELKNISDKINETFNTHLETYGFLKNSNKIETNIIEHVYVKHDLYIKIIVSFNLRDFPYYFNIALGEGPLSFPESDWNSIPLWRLSEPSSSTKAGYYLIEDITNIDQVLEHGRLDLEKYGSNFLNGELSTFKEARKSQNKEREPYKVYIPKEDGTHEKIVDEDSKRLKKKYSK